MKKGRLRFHVDLGSPELGRLDIPVEVRQPNLIPAARGLSSQSIELDPGTYYVTARLPSGHELFSQVLVEEDREVTVHLEAEPDEKETTPYDWRRKQVLYAKMAPTVRAVHAEAKLRIFTGNVLQDDYQTWAPYFSPADWERGKGRAHASLSGSNAPQYVQLLQPYEPPLNVAFPAWVETGCQLVVTALPNRLTLDIQLQNPQAEMLLRYRERGFLKEAATVADSISPTAEDLLLHKGEDPIAATVGAYALLHFGEMERLHGWTANLEEWFPWLPDGITVRAEHLARLGKHDEAFDTLLKLPSCGLPLFSEGLSYAIDRIRFYLKLEQDQFEEKLLAQARELLQQLQRHASFVDFAEPILTFTGLDPAAPDDRTLDEEDFVSAEGYSIELG